MKLDVEHLSRVLADEPDVLLATLFGSAQDGDIREGGDVDVGVLLSPRPRPLDFYDFYQRIASRIAGVDDLDLIDLSRAGSVLAFEALCGRRLVTRDAEKVAGFVSETARQYEDDMLHAR